MAVQIKNQTGTTETITAGTEISVRDGHLYVTSPAGDGISNSVHAIYAPGAWRFAEVKAPKDEAGA